MKNNSMKLKIEHSVFATNFEIIQAIVSHKLCILYVFSVFVWIKMQWLPLYLNEKITSYVLDCSYEYIYFILLFSLVI